MTLDDILTLVEAGEDLGVSAETLRTQIRRGRFEARLLGKTWITTRQEVERYRREQLGNVGRPALDVHGGARNYEAAPGVGPEHGLTKGRVEPTRRR